LITGDGVNAASSDPADEGGNTAVLVRESLIWESLVWTVQTPDEVPETPTTLATSDFTRIYLTQYKELVRLAWLLVHDKQTATEVVQNAFEALNKAWRPRLRDLDGALLYLRQAVINNSRSVLRH
jgi:hypothetical protein